MPSCEPNDPLRFHCTAPPYSPAFRCLLHRGSSKTAAELYPPAANDPKLSRFFSATLQYCKRLNHQQSELFFFPSSSSSPQKLVVFAYRKKLRRRKESTTATAPERAAIAIAIAMAWELKIEEGMMCNNY